MYPDSKMDITSKIRSKIRTSNYPRKNQGERKNIAIEFCKAFKKVNSSTPELIAFILQKFNAYH